MKIYISGKITGLPIEEAKAKFADAATQMEDAGYTAYDPMHHVQYDPTWTWEMYMKADIALLCLCDAIYMLDNWQDSTGAKIEHDLAKSLNMTIIYSDPHGTF